MKLTIFGLGIVGSSFYKIISKIKKNVFTFSKKNKYNLLLNKKKIFFLLKKKNFFIELIGGIGISIEIILNSIKLKNLIITANKDLISKYYFILSFLFKKKNLKIYFEASVCGSMPIIKLFKNNFLIEHILYFIGIINGTNNFILTNLKNNNFKKLINLSIKKGFAEKNNKNDILGFDSNYKLSIISNYLLKYNFNFLKILLYSIFGLNNFLCKIFYIKKYLAIYFKINNFFIFYVDIFLTKNYLLYKTFNSLNIVIINCKYSKKNFLLSRGAGGTPTASSVLYNYYELFNKKFFKNFNCFNSSKKLSNNFICCNYILLTKFSINLFFFIKILKIKIIKFILSKNILIKTKKIFYKKILFLIFLINNNNYYFNKLL